MNFRVGILNSERVLAVNDCMLVCLLCVSTCRCVMSVLRFGSYLPISCMFFNSV